MSRSMSTGTNAMDLNSSPQQLISTQGHEEGGHGINLVENTVNALSSRTKPAVVVAIIGKSRTGKSYLLNKLAGRDVQDNEKRFKVGAQAKAQTHGIWIWVVDHPTKLGHDLILLDTEGLGDPEKANTENDKWIYCLATLLGSTLVLNIKGSIDTGTIDDISFATQMSKVMKVDAKTESDEEESDGDLEFDAYFPSLVVTIRDFGLVTGGDDDSYLENMLKLKKGDDKMTLNFNKPRECIRKYFHARKCFTFDSPGNRKVCTKMADGDDSNLDEEFVDAITEFKNYILDKCPVKTLQIGVPITGRMLAELLKSYVCSIQNGCPPCIEEAVEKMAASENKILVEEGIEIFKTEIGKLPPPVRTLGAFQSAKQKAEIAAVELFSSRTINDISGKCHLKLKDQIEEEACKQLEIHKAASKKKCIDLLKQMFQGVKDKMGDLKGLDGKRDFEFSLNEIHSKFMGRQDLGMKKNEVIIHFLQEKQKDFDEIQMMESFQLLTTKVKITEEEEEKEDKEKQSENEQELLNKYADLGRKAIQRKRLSTMGFDHIQLARRREADRLKVEGFDTIAKEREQGLLKTQAIQNDRLASIRRKVSELEEDLETIKKRKATSPKKGFLGNLWQKITGKKDHIKMRDDHIYFSTA